MMMQEGERQRGPQEVDIVSIANPITKYASTVTKRIGGYTIGDVVKIALDHPRGPVWLDVPLDIQGAER